MTPHKVCDCIIPPRRLGGWHPAVGTALSTAPLESVLGWFWQAIPVNSQGQTPRCESYSTSNVIEMLIRRHVGRDAIPVGMQVNPDPLFIAGRAATAPTEGLDDGGLPLGTSLAQAVALGLLPASTEIITVELTAAAIVAQLQTAPLVCGEIIHDGWWTPSRANGCIPWNGYPGQVGGHATALLAVDAADPGNPGICIQNSWLESDGTPWGRGGYGVVQWTDFVCNAIEAPKSVRVTTEWISKLAALVADPAWRAKWYTAKWDGPR